ncbi:hypothetical protein Cni_G07938 [Canna indica]|uniref:Regulator of Vps4 activity in the MVB pathway protein n=1 Tax=Canna indica TaxID=4628 RepID=A0AAQ3JZK3_9LILI|nr:hypothetical protein Cni_G07938 [Canna indica]
MHTRSKITDMLPKSFKPQKCKTSLKLAVSRIKLLKNKRDASLKQMRRDLAQLLETGQDQTARIRVEHVIREEKTMSAYDLIEIYCEIIDSRLPIIESQKNCPIDLKEAIASVIFASPRCADIPELMDIRKHFTAKYGKEFVKAALEVRPECGVNRMVIEKLSAQAPDVKTKIKVLNEVAKEHNIKWESKAFEEEVQKPKDDLLGGPSSFSSSEKMTIKSSDVKPSFVNSWNSEPTTKASQHNRASQSQDVRSTYAKEENASMHRSNWKMEFKDATSAAEAAAESAERASMAARAAAELASRGNISRQSSGGSYETSAYNAAKGEKNEYTKNSNLARNDVAGASVAVEDDKIKFSHSEKPKMQNLHKDDMVRTSTLTGGDDTLNSYSTARENVMPEKPQFSSSSIGHVVSEVDLHEDSAVPYNYARENFSVLGSASNTKEKDDEEDYDSRHDILSSIYSNKFHQYTTKDDHEDYNKVDSSGVHYDNYDSDTGDHSFPGWHSGGNLLDSFSPQPREEPSSVSLDTDSWSHKQGTTGSPSNYSSSQLHSLTEPLQNDSSETKKKADFLSDSDEYLPPKYDSPKYDSEGPSSESEDEMEKPDIVEAVRPSSFLHTDNISRKGSLPAQTSHEIFMDPTVEVDEDNRNSPSTVLRDVDKLEIEPSSNEKKWRSSLSVQNNQHNQRRGSSPQGGGAKEDVPAFTVTSDEGYDSGLLNFGRLTGGLRNRGYTRPPYVRNTTTNVSSTSEVNSENLINEKETSVSMSKFSTSPEVMSEGKISKDLHTNAFRPKVRANVVTYLESEAQSLHHDVEHRGSGFESPLRSSDDTSAVRGRPVSSQYKTSYEDVEDPVHESYIPQQQKKYHKESLVRSSFTNTNVDIKEEQIYTSEDRQWRDNVSSPKSQKLDVSSFADKSTVHHPNKTPLNSEVEDQGPNRYARGYDSSYRTPINYNLDGNEAETPEAQPTSVRGGSNVVRLSRRTRATLSADDQSVTSPVKESKSTLPNSAAGSSSGKTKYTRYLDDIESSKPQQSYSFAEETSAKNLQTESSMVRNPRLSQDEFRRSSVKENVEKSKTSSEKSTSRESSLKNNDQKSKISSEKSISRESSLKNTSHVHPKLPDIDSLTAHFQSLRANVRPK